MELREVWEHSNGMAKVILFKPPGLQKQYGFGAWWLMDIRKNALEGGRPLDTVSLNAVMDRVQQQGYRKAWCF